MQILRPVLAVTVFLLGFRTALACSCGGPGSMCSVYFGTPVIFRGTVVKKTLERPPLQTVTNLDGTTSQIISPGTYEVHFAVTEAFRGAEGKKELTVYTAEQSSACGFPFEVGVEYLVFTYSNKAGDQLWTSKCSKTHALKNADGDTDIAWMHSLGSAPPGGRIFGSVMLARSTPGPASKLSLNGPVHQDLTSDEKGAYEATGLPPGEYKVSAVMPPGFTTSAPERTVQLHDKGCAEVDWYATYDGHVRGRVTDADGHPVPHLSMDLRRQDGDLHSTLHYKTTDEDGRYDFDAVEPGEYFVIANSMGVSPDRPYPKVFYPGAVAAGEVTPVKIGPSASVDSIDLVMPRPWKKITVKTKVIEADGSPAAGVSVYGYDRGYRSSMEPMTAKTDADGTATLPLYENHEYFITATKTGGTQQRCAGPLKIVAQDGLDTGILRIEHPWGNCLAQLNPNFRAPH